MTTETGKHTPTPWRVKWDRGNRRCRVVSDNAVVATIHALIHQISNADYIVACVNAHDALTQERDRLRKVLERLASECAELAGAEDMLPVDRRAYKALEAIARAALEGAARSGGEG